MAALAEVGSHAVLDAELAQRERAGILTGRPWLHVPGH